VTIDCPPAIADVPAGPVIDQPGMVMWIGLLLAALAYELWAIHARRQTLSNVVRRGPRWFQWLVGGGFAFLLWHLFVTR